MSGKRMLVVAGNLALVALLVVAVLFVRRLQYPKFEHDEVAGAGAVPFRSDEAASAAAAGDHPLHGEVHRFFERLGAAMDAEDGTAVADLFHADGTLDLIDQQGLLTGTVADLSREKQVDAVTAGLGKLFADFGYYYRFDSFTIVRLDKGALNTLVAYVKLWDNEYEVYTRMRWWMVKTPGSDWRAYDYEDVLEGSRMSQQLGIGFQAVGTRAPWMNPLLELYRVVAEIPEAEDMDTERLRAACEDLLATDPPPFLEASALALSMAYLVEEEHAPELIGNARRLRELEPASALGDYMLATAHELAGQWDEAMDALEAYVSYFGWDAETRGMAARIELAAGEREEAAAHALAGLADQSDSWECALHLCRALPADRKQTALPHLERTDDPDAVMEFVMDELTWEEVDPEAAAVLAAFREAGLDEGLAEYYEGEIAAGEEAEAESPVEGD